MERSLALIIFLCVLIAATCAGKTYKGFQVIQSTKLNKDGLENVLSKVLSNAKYQIWTEPRLNMPAEILVHSDHTLELLELMTLINLDAKIYIQDVESVLHNERKMIEEAKNQEIRSLSRNVTFDRYMDLDEITQYLIEVAAFFPEIAVLEPIGVTYEGRRQNLLKLSNGAAPGKIDIFVDAAIHAAEWQGPPVALNIIYQLTANLSANQQFLDMADWYILPVANPDGYVYSWTEDRLWRKTRRPNEGSDCVGTDPNRNFDVHWGEGENIDDPCLWSYPGTHVYSEIESKNIADYLTSLSGKLHLYTALHSYGAVFLLPYGYTATEFPPNYDELSYVANLTAEALETVRGTQYTYGSSGVVLNLAYGNSKDFAYDVAGARFSYTWELPTGGPNGHDPPASEIKPVVEETWTAYRELVQQVYNSVNGKNNK